MRTAKVLNLVEFVVVCDDGVLRSPSKRPDVCRELYVVHNGIIKASIKRRGKPKWFTRHFAGVNAAGTISPDKKEYHIEIEDEETGEVLEEVYEVLA